MSAENDNDPLPEEFGQGDGTGQDDVMRAIAALQAAGVDAKDVDLLIVGTTTPDSAVTIWAGPPRSRHATGNPCASASTTTFPLESRRLGKRRISCDA